MTVLLLNTRRCNRRVRNDAALHQQLSASATAGLQPLLVEPEKVAVRGARRALADLAEDVDEADELLPELGEDRRERITFDATEYVVRAAADAHVVVDVDDFPVQRIREKARDEE